MGVEDHGKYRINLKSSNYDKLAMDIHNVINVLKKTVLELDAKGTIQVMEKVTDAMKQMQLDEKKLLEDVNANQKYIDDLRHQCEKERVHNISTIEEMNTKIQKLKFDGEDIQLYGKLEAAYFKKWEISRREQNVLSCQEMEQRYKNIINSTKEEIRLEDRVHLEFEKFLTESRNDFLNEIQYWMKHIDEETERRDIEIMNLKIDLEKLDFELAEAKQTYEFQTAAMEDWLAYKKKKEEKEAQVALELNAATIIQAWWRGVMYRKKLGPYRKKKKGKGKKDVKKKK